MMNIHSLPSVQYTKFDQQNTDGVFLVKMSGLATDYKSIALQADVFNSAKGRSFKNVVFSNLTKNKNNNVAFDIEFTVDPALLSYEKSIALEQIQSKSESVVPASDVRNQNQGNNPLGAPQGNKNNQ